VRSERPTGEAIRHRFPTREEVIGREPLAGELKELLLGLGGRRVVLPALEPDLAALLERGRLWDASKVEMRPLRRSSCHSNTASLWCDSQMRVKIMTGYALSDGGLWVQHSWGWNGRQAVETTVGRSLYFGYQLDDGESLRFTLANRPPFLERAMREAHRLGDEGIFVECLYAKLPGLIDLMAKLVEGHQDELPIATPCRDSSPAGAARSG
jgi:hypothetical protein